LPSAMYPIFFRAEMLFGQRTTEIQSFSRGATCTWNPKPDMPNLLGSVANFKVLNRRQCPNPRLQPFDTYRRPGPGCSKVPFV
jgi:hypothetical protein